MAVLRIRYLALLLLIGLGLPPLAQVGAQEARKKASEILPSSVILLRTECETSPAPDGDPMGVPILDTCLVGGSGSGTILTAQGLILTNAHVALDSFEDPNAQPIWLIVGLTTSARELPTFTFFARAIVYDGGVDLALIVPMYTLNGRRIERGDLTLPPLAISDKTEAVDIEEPVRLIGYPGVGGSTVTVVQAVVAGFTPDQNVPEMGGAGFIKTDLAAGSGVSGGTAVNDLGVLVGVPTGAGMTDIRCQDVNGDGINDPVTECRVMGGEVGYVRPMPEGLNVLLERGKAKGQVGADGQIPTEPRQPQDPTPTPDETPEPVETPEPSPTPEQPRFPTLPGQEDEETAIITGTLVSADTGDPIEGGVVIVFQPGVTVEAAIERKDSADIFTAGESGAAGRFQLQEPVVRGERYSMLIVAEGYKAIGGDDLVLARETDPATVNLGEIPLATAE